MKKVIPVVGAAAAVALVLSFFTRHLTASATDDGSSNAMAAEVSAQGVANTADDLRKLRRQGTASSGRIARLEARLREMEDRLAKGAQEQKTAQDEQQPSDDGKLATSDFGDWMKQEAREDDFDREQTKTVSGKLAERLEEMPGVRMEEVSCSKRFCVSTFVREDGGKIDSPVQLYEMPPFRELFTLDKEDGRLEIYYIQPGESLAELEQEALASAAVP